LISKFHSRLKLETVTILYAAKLHLQPGSRGRSWNW